MIEPTMANAALTLSTNADGDFFVDSTCIDCDACRAIAPAVFGEAGGQSAVLRQPKSPAELLSAEKALLACPTSSIGTRVKRSMTLALSVYPEPVDGEVYFCGFTSEKSYGALSYLIVRPEGNILIDSPRFSRPLVRNIERLGGVATMLLTHRDDVADHQKFHDHFSCERLLHADDVSDGTRGVEIQPVGRDPREVLAGVTMIPVPGHTRGHAVFLYRNRYLFTGDHLAWNEDRIRLYAFRSACWFSWEEQKRSMRSLLPFAFEWVLPGHGRRVRLPEKEMRQQLERCIGWM